MSGGRNAAPPRLRFGAQLRDELVECAGRLARSVQRHALDLRACVLNAERAVSNMNDQRHLLPDQGTPQGHACILYTDRPRAHCTRPVGLSVIMKALLLPMSFDRSQVSVQLGHNGQQDVSNIMMTYKWKEHL